MSTAHEIVFLREERRLAINEIAKLETILQNIKERLQNAQNATHQRRLDAEHRRALALRYAHQDKITEINARLKLMNSRVRIEQAAKRREKV